MKYLLIAILIVLSGCSHNNLGVDDSVSIEKELIKIQQDQEKDKTGKYKHVEKYEKEGIFYEANTLDIKDKSGYEIIVNNGINIITYCYGEDVGCIDSVELISSSTLQ